MNHKSPPAEKARENLRPKLKGDYGVGLGAVVVVSVFTSELSLGFLLKVFGSAGFVSGTGEEAGATTSVFCSQAPKSAAPARMQISFFIVWIGFSYWGKARIGAMQLSAFPSANLPTSRPSSEW